MTERDISKEITDAIFGKEEPGVIRAIPHTRHGEEGILFVPTVRLNEQELKLYGNVWEAWGDRVLGDRNDVIALVKQVAGPERQHMVEKVMAFIDEHEFVCSQSQGKA